MATKERNLSSPFACAPGRWEVGELRGVASGLSLLCGWVPDEARRAGPGAGGGSGSPALADPQTVCSARAAAAGCGASDLREQ